ncbi:AmmeMemoRadiSam system protein B [Fodinibius salinus]|uniref:AmmeMemoRadiSam system protein B n=1 Tax=Fodinibius salinus TaxID=860790 RepID=A0A5D3YMI5_9BACT|nr:AmmeMemoRadiSam system protein B [Fodinibius salinus]TYP95375.1 AmmeMemoRadiSam system protein B [Fodinibius salinus]
MNITSYKPADIQRGIVEAKKKSADSKEHVRLLFAPERIDDDNFEDACAIYSRVEMSTIDTVVVVESHDEKLDKKLPMASNMRFETPVGSVPVDDYMRNEFCDEDDDFFIHDEAFDKDISLFQQLMFLQTLSDDFKALSVQIADPSPAIVKELAYVLEEVLASRNALIVFCCELDNNYKQEFQKVMELLNDDNQSGLMNYLNSGESKIKGVTSFIAGIIVADKWQVDLSFLSNNDESNTGSLLTAYSNRQTVRY